MLDFQSMNINDIYTIFEYTRPYLVAILQQSQAIITSLITSSRHFSEDTSPRVIDIDVSLF